MDGATVASKHVAEYPLLDEILTEVSAPVRLARNDVSALQSSEVDAEA